MPLAKPCGTPKRMNKKMLGLAVKAAALPKSKQNKRAAKPRKRIER